MSKEDHLPEIPLEFNKWVEKSLGVLSRISGDAENNEIEKILVSEGIESREAREILIFLPIAFCRKLLPKVNWLDEYIDYYSENKQVRRKYSENTRYKAISIKVDDYWQGNPSQQVVLKVAGRSAEFKTINELLLNGGKLEEVELTETYIVR